jgi:Uma2 family endonuclease
VSPTNAPATRATYADVLAAPDHVNAELIDGRLFMTPRPAVLHAHAAWQLGRLIPRTVERDWVFLSEPELHLGGDDPALIPDLAGWRRDRFPALAEGENPAFLTVAPDWVCEVLSPGTEKLDRAEKAPRYAQAGVGHLWLINPIARTLEVRRLIDGLWLVAAVFTDADQVRAEPFDFVFALDALWWPQAQASDAPPR